MKNNSRILVIDDQRSIHLAFRMIFERGETDSLNLEKSEQALWGPDEESPVETTFEIHSAHQGEEGVRMVQEALAEEQPYSLAFVDVRMPPGWDGIETVGNLWRVDSNLQVVLCTAYSDYSLGEILEKLGRSDGLLFLKKPFDNMEVYQLANALTQKWRMAEKLRTRMEELKAHLDRGMEQLRITNEKLINESKRVHALADEAHTANRAKSEFLAMISHEIRTPMNGFLGMMEQLQETELSDEQAHLVSTAVESGDLLLEILNGLIDYSKLEAGRVTLERRNFDLGRTIDIVLKLFEPSAKAKGLKLSCFFEPEISALIRGDENRIKQILINLISNAIKFTSKGEVALQVTLEENPSGQVILYCEVIDTGIGISADSQDKLFKPFEQADITATRRYGGTGLGLAICENLVKLMDGEIGVRSSLGDGSVFWFRITLEPVRGDDKVGASSEESTDKVPIEAAPTFELSEENRQKIEEIHARALIVEDNNVNSKVIGTLLKKQKIDYDVAVNGVEAVNLWNRGDYHFIVMDIQMPIMDGYEATNIIRTSELERGLSPIPIVACTASVLGIDQDACVAAGMDYFLSKPVRKNNLLEILEQILIKNSGQNVGD